LQEQEYTFKRSSSCSRFKATFYYPKKELIITESPIFTEKSEVLFNGKLRSLSDLKDLEEMLFE